MVFIVDREENVLFVNQVAARALGRESADVVGRKQGAFFGPDLAARHSHVISQVFRTGEMVMTENQQDLHAAAGLDRHAAGSHP